MAFGGLRGVRHSVVRGLARACEGVDTLMYRPLVVRATERLPVFWHCQLCQFSQWLNDRWKTAYWDDTKFWVTDLYDACGWLAEARARSVCWRWRRPTG